ncbi:NADP-dependent oxidoreductase domain-containing protein [Trametes gibbosa]|nr:NADP-dependent oxidoreductase domain-containing protein [Trametes gibbosa]
MPSAQYKPLSQHDGDEEQLSLDISRVRNRKRLLFHVLAIASVMYVAYLGVRAITRTPKSGLGKPCHKAHRNVSSLPSHFNLPSGHQIPSVALGVWKAEKDQVGDAVKTALKAGYKHIDGAWVYRNEEEVGQALKDSGVPREQIWLTSKLWNTFHAPEDVETALDVSLQALGTEYLDLYLIHWPIAFKKGSNNVFDEELTVNPYPTWKKLEELVDKGKVRNIGVSNFNIARLRNLTANPLKYKPAVNQVELNFWNPQPELLKWAKEHDLLLEAYSPLGSNNQVKETLQVPEVQAIAKELGITPAQAIISWHVQRGTVVLPKTVTPSRVVENLRVVKLPEVLFDKLEKAAAAHPPKRVVNPSQGWGLSFDIFNDDGGVTVPEE